MIFFCSSFRRKPESSVFRVGRKQSRWIPAFAGMTALLFGSITHAADRDLRVPDHLQQGQLVVAHAPKGVKIEYDGRRLRIGEDGVFIFGLPRDAPAQVKLHVRYSNGKAQDFEYPVKKREYHIERVEGLPQKTVTPDPATAKRIAVENKRKAEARRRDDEREDFLGGFTLPVEGAPIGGVYGSQRIDNGVPVAPHFGLDMQVPIGTPIKAPAPGIVTLVQPDMILDGGIVLIDHGFGLSTATIHMSRIDVKAGERVERGQQIGLSGTTGRSTGPHVHWAATWLGVQIDPALLPKVGTEN
jgi:murein DD-endopeptidase MepM/ murein hydrolase activator NlpD